MNEELKSALEALKGEIKGANVSETKSVIDAFEIKMADAIALQVKDGNDALKTELEVEIKAIKEQSNILGAKLNESKSKKVEGKTDEVKGLITKNFDAISEVRKGKSVELKDMTLGTSLTGDQPRDYSNNVVMNPAQKVNVSDLIGMVSISGGTYTFPREGAKTGDFGYQVEGDSKAELNYTLEMIDVNTDFLAGFTRYSKKMRNNLPFLESFLPNALRRDYAKAENSDFYTKISTAATASAVVTGNKVERLIAEIASLEGADYDVNGVVVNISDWWDIQITEKSTGAGYGLPGVVTYENGVLRINGIPVYKATWIASGKYLVGDWSRINKVVTEGLSLEFNEVEGTNFVKNNITARLEAQVNVAVEQPLAIVFGDFASV